MRKEAISVTDGNISNTMARRAFGGMATRCGAAGGGNAGGIMVVRRSPPCSQWHRGVFQPRIERITYEHSRIVAHRSNVMAMI